MQRAAEKSLPFWTEFKGGKGGEESRYRANRSLKAIVLSGWGVDQESGLKLTPPAATCFPGTKDVGPSSTCNKCDMQAQDLSLRLPVAAGLSYLNNRHGRGKRIKIMKAHPGE